MIGIMLLGAWFLVHQHCCVADIRAATRNNLVDHLMRRSPLEKNFMRYGRSWPPTNFPHNGVWQLDEKMDKPEKKGKTGRDIMRFGRSMWAPLGGAKANDGYANQYPFLPGSQFRIKNVLSPGIGTEKNRERLLQIGLNGKYFEYHQPEGLGIVRNKKNFIRFGRNSKHVSSGDSEYVKVNKNLSITGQESKPNYWDNLDGAIDEGTDMTYVGYAKGSDPQMKHKLLYINCVDPFELKLGHSHDQQLKRTIPDDCVSSNAENSDRTLTEGGTNAPHVVNSDYVREQDKSANTPTSTDEDIKSRSLGLRFRGLAPPLTLDATSFIAPEFLLLPDIPHQQNPNKRANNFIRLG